MPEVPGMMHDGAAPDGTTHVARQQQPVCSAASEQACMHVQPGKVPQPSSLLPVLKTMQPAPNGFFGVFGVQNGNGN
jgi:hypothetical protein